MTQSGAQVVSLGTRHNLAEAKTRYASLSFQGNVDHGLLARGSVEQVRHATEECLRQGGGQRHVLNLSHGVDRSTPVENFAQFVSVARERRAAAADPRQESEP